MATQNPRISAMVEPPLYAAVEALAKRDGMSLSQKARDLLREALELDEDADLAVLVGDRKRRRGKFLSHEVFWKHAREQRRR